MNKAFLLAAISSLALCAQAGAAGAGPSTRLVMQSAASPKGAQILYNQNSNGTGGSANSQNYTSGVYSSYNDAGADDFVIPKNSKWMISQVDVSGMYYDGYGAATENVTFYEDDHGKPGKAVKKGTFTKLAGADTGGSFAIKLPGRGLSLKSGTYWVSVVINCSAVAGCNQWGWETTSTVHGNQAVWESPRSGGNCTTWGTLEQCFGASGDFLFDLRGKAKR